jgi:hypothetical protein
MGQSTFLNLKERAGKQKVLCLTIYIKLCHYQCQEGGSAMKEPERKQVNMYLDVDTICEIDRLAEKVGISRSRLARNLLLMGLDDAKTLDAFGIFTLIRKWESLKGSRGKEELQTA